MADPAEFLAVRLAEVESCPRKKRFREKKDWDRLRCPNCTPGYITGWESEQKLRGTYVVTLEPCGCQVGHSFIFEPVPPTPEDVHGPNITTAVPHNRSTSWPLYPFGGGTVLSQSCVLLRMVELNTNGSSTPSGPFRVEVNRREAPLGNCRSTTSAAHTDGPTGHRAESGRAIT